MEELKPESPELRTSGNLEMNIASPSDRRFYIGFTVGVPGLGKSFMIKKLKDVVAISSNHTMEVSVSDQARSGHLAKYYQEHKIDLNKLTHDEIFKIEVDQGPAIKQALLDDIVTRLKTLRDGHQKHNFFVIDKNLSAQSLITFVEEQVSKILSGFKVQYFIVIPNQPELAGDRSFYPFHIDTVLVGLYRSLNRKEHVTMKFGPVHSLLSFTSCLEGQIKDNFDQKFPEGKYQRLYVRYYLKDKSSSAKESSKDITAACTKLRELLLDIINKKTTCEKAAAEIVNLVQVIEPMNIFGDFGQEAFEKFLEHVEKDFESTFHRPESYGKQL